MIGVTFGQCLFHTSHARVEPDSDVHFGLLLYVAAAPGAGPLRDDVAEVMWSGSDPDHARHSLRQAMYRLRQLGFSLRLRAGRVVFQAEAAVDLATVLREGDSLSRDQLLTYGTLPFLPGYTPKLGAVFSEWVEGLRVQVGGTLRRSLVSAVREARAEAAFRDVHKLARALLALDPLNETGTLALAEALAMEGSKVEALRMLEAYEEEVGGVEEGLRLPARTLRRRVSENLADALLPRRYEVPFVGRVDEFGLMRRLFAESRHGSARCAVITGEAGIGKTRLATELLRLAILDGATTTTYTCTSGDTQSPLSSLLHITQALLALPGALGCAREHLQYLRRVVAPEAPGEGRLEGVPADVAYAQLVYALTELASAIADEAPLVVFIDDAHRLHQTAWRLFTDLVDRIETRGILLIVTARKLPEWYTGLGICGSGGRAHVVRLASLGAAEAERFVEVWSEKNGVAVGAEERSAIAAWSAGNPFYLSELAAHVGRGGDVSQAPPSVRGLIELQYAATTREAHRVLAVVSLLQSRATAERVTRVLRIEPSGFLSALEELEDVGLVAASGQVLRTKHDLVGDVALRLSPPGVLGYLRFRVASCLEEEAGETENLELLGDSLTQWEGLGDSKRVYEVGMRLGDGLLASGMAREASSSFQRAASAASSDDQFCSTIERAIGAARLNNDFVEIARLAPERQKRRRHAEAIALADVNVAEARYWCGDFIAEPWLYTVAADRSASPQLRMRAAEAAAVFADHEWDHERVRLVASGVADLSASDADNGFLRLVVTTVTGRRSDVEDEVSSFLSGSRQCSDGEHARDSRRAAEALLRVGSRERALPLLLESASISRRLRLSGQTITTLHKLGLLYLAELRVADARELEAELSATPGSNPLEAVLHRHLTAYLAWVDSDQPLAVSILGSLEAGSAREPKSARIGTLSSWLAAALAARHPLSDGVVREARSMMANVGVYGTLDLDVAVIVDALRQTGNHEHARRIAEDYFCLIRERGVDPAPVLRQVLERQDHRAGSPR